MAHLRKMYFWVKIVVVFDLPRGNQLSTIFGIVSLLNLQVDGAHLTYLKG